MLSSDLSGVQLDKEKGLGFKRTIEGPLAMWHICPMFVIPNRSLASDCKADPKSKSILTLEKNVKAYKCRQ